MKLKPQLRATREIPIPARTGIAFELRAGDYVRLTDVAGQQAADFWAFRTADPDEYLSAEHTRSYNWRLFPAIGQSFCTNHRRPIVQLVEDTVGVHDMLISACDPYRYRMYGVEEAHASCTENLLIAMKGLGIDRIRVPSPVNFFCNFRLGSDGTIEPLAGTSKAGDSVLLRAWIGCVVAISACPMDLNPVNGFAPTDLLATVLTADGAA